MLRCGGAFSELVQIGRKVEELQGYTGRIVELFDALSSKKAAPRFVEHPSAGRSAARHFHSCSMWHSAPCSSS
jgi:hypothetical protein